MTPEQRFFPARDDDELRVHDDFLAAHGDVPRGEVLRAQGTPAGQDIGKALPAVHGKNNPAPAPETSTGRSFPPWQFLVSTLCALMVHALILSAAVVWFGAGGGGTGGPMLIALELSGGGTGGEMTAGKMSASAGPSKAPQDGPAIQSPAAQVAAQIPEPSAPAVKKQVQTDHSAPVSTAKKTNSSPVKDTPARPAPPVKEIPKQTIAQTPNPAKTEELATLKTGDEPAKDIDDSDPDVAEAGSKASETTASAPKGTGHSPGAGTGTGATGSGDSGTGGTNGKVGTAGDPGAGGSLVRFGTPGGPGIVRMTQPRYPHEAKRQGKEGVVVMKLSLDATGAVYDVQILQGAGFGMDEASREAVMLSRFRPATSRGKPIPSQAILPIHFKLR